MTSIGPYPLDDIYCGDSAVMLAALPDGCLAKKFCLQPSKRPGIGAIVYVAVILADVTRLAKRLNIVNIAMPAPADGDNMIRRQLDIITATSKAFVTVMIAQRLKLGGSVRTARFSLSGAAAVRGGISLTRIFLLPSSLAICYHVWILLPIAAIIIRLLIRISYIVTSLSIRYRVSVGSFPLAVSVTLAFLAVTPLIPVAGVTLFTRFSVFCGHQKSSFALVAKGALEYTLFATSADTTVRHAPETLARLPGFSFFNCLIIPNLHTAYHRCDLARRRVAAANVPLPLFVEQPAKPRQDVLL